jgi:hypothetical protein
MTHYRIRGIDGVIAHESGIAGYSQTDFLKWQRGESLIPLRASDLSDWEMGYGKVASISTASTAVPEPSSTLLLISLAAISVFSRRKTVP